MKNLFLLICLVCSLPVWSLTYEVVYQKGKVEITRSGKPVSPPVLTGDRVVVHKGGILVLKAPQEVLKLMGDTIIEPTQEKEETMITLVRGALVSQVTNKAFKVKTRSTSFGVRGTQFFVSAQGGDDVWMCVKEGVVNAQNPKSSVDVPAGKGIFADAKEITKPQPFAWTKGINWKMSDKEGDLDHKVKLNYDLLENFYD